MARSREDLAENRSARVMVVILVLLVVGFVALAVGGSSIGLWGLSYVAGGLSSGVAVVVAAQVPRLRKLALVLGVAALPVSWVVLGLLPGSAHGPDSSNAEAAVQGFGISAAVIGSMGLFGPNRRA